MPVLSATDFYVAQLHSMSIRIPPIARGNLRKIQRGQEVKSDILQDTLHGLQCTIETAQRKKRNRDKAHSIKTYFATEHFPH